MTRVRVEDLPPKLREQVLARADGESDGPAPVKQAAHGGPPRRARGEGTPYRCHTCRALFPRYGKAAEAHADAHGGARLEAILPGPAANEANEFQVART